MLLRVFRTLAMLLLSPGLLPLASSAQEEPVDATIRHLAEFWRVPKLLRSAVHPVDMEVTVHYYDPLYHLFWGETEGHTDFLPCADVPLPIRSGQRVRIQGTMVPNRGLSGDAVTVAVLEENQLPAPIDAAGRLLERAALNQKMVVVEGKASRLFQPDAHHAVWQITSEQQTLNARMYLRDGEIPPDVGGMTVQVTGLYVSKDTQEIELWIPKLDGIRAVSNGSAGEQKSDVIRSLTQFWDMPPATHGTLQDASLDLVVNYYDPPWGLLWAVSNGSQAYIDVRDGTLPIRSGQRVRIEGKVMPGKGILADRAKVTVLEERVDLPAERIAGILGDGNRLERRLVLLEGFVDREAVVEGHHKFWDVVSEGHAVSARMYYEPGAETPDLTGKRVRLRGLYSPKLDPTGGLFGIDLWIPSVSDIEVLGTVADDPRFNRPFSPIHQLSNVEGLVRVVGTLREFEPGRRAIIRDATGQIELLHLQSQSLLIGDRVEAIGYPSVTGLKRTLRTAVLRRLENPDEVSTRLTGTPTELRSVDRVLELKPEEAASGRAVEISGLVIWSNPVADFLYLLDMSGAVRVQLADGSKPPAPENAILVTGITASGDYAPYITQARFSSRGAMILPRGQTVELEQAMTGNLEGQWLEMRGYVTRIEPDGVWHRMTLTAPSGEFIARVPRDADLTGILGSVARVRGVCQAIANERRQLSGVQMWVIDRSHIRIEAAAPSDPYSIARQSVASLRQFSLEPAINRWVHVRGTVLHQGPDHTLFIEDDQDGLMVDLHSDKTFAPGDVVECVGLPGLRGRRAVLREAVARKVESGQPVAPLPLQTLKPLLESMNDRLATARGTLVSVLHQGDEVFFAIEKDEAVFDAVLAHPAGSPLPPDWVPGSEVDVTGIYRLDYNDGVEPHSFRLQVRSPEDVNVLRPAPWWTLGRTLAVIAILVGGGALGFFWALSLRQRVQRQTDLIRAQFAKEANLEARNRSIVENASDFIFTADLHGQLTAFNPAGERITGYTREEALQMNLRDLIASVQDAGHANETLRGELGGGATFQTRLRTKEGQAIWVEISSRFIAENGRATGVLGIVRDISERKQFEDRLEAARDAAEASARAKSAFLANMSHEVRTPMNGVIGVANLLLDTPLTHEQRDFAETIRVSAESLLTILNDILDFSKIEAGKLDFENVPFDLTDTVASAVDLLAARAAAKNLELAVHIPSQIPQHLVGDPGRLRQILLNLVGNALKFTESGEVLVNVRVLSQSDAETELRFEVVDTGIGLTPEEASRLFKPFSQADTSTTRRFGGTGLGLAICKQIAELMKGSIGVESTKGAGATFWFTVRLPRQTGKPPATGRDATLAGRRVLIVDHNATSTRILRDYLETAGMDCTVHPHLQTAASDVGTCAADGRPYDFVLLNYTVSDAELTAWRDALALPVGTPRPAAILLSLVDRRFSKEKLSAAQIDLMLAKPIHRRDLLTGMRRLITGIGTASPVRSSAAAVGIPSLTGAGTARALVVEDNVVNQRVARVVLERMGFRVEVAGNGYEALEAIERTVYDLVLMDCQMPEMDGYEATRRIRSGRHSGVRIVAMTANAMEGDRDRCLTAGMDDYVSKPMRVDELRAALERTGILGHGEAVGNL